MQLDDLKILICDDSILARKQMKDIINSIGSPEIMEYDSSATIFVASSVGTQSELKKALAAGACDFIQKPIDKDQVISLIKKHIGGN